MTHGAQALMSTQQTLASVLVLSGNCFNTRFGHIISSLPKAFFEAKTEAQRGWVTSPANTQWRWVSAMLV